VASTWAIYKQLNAGCLRVIGNVAALCICGGSRLKPTIFAFDGGLLVLTKMKSCLRPEADVQFLRKRLLPSLRLKLRQPPLT
jgi:hypothetical protein